MVLAPPTRYALDMNIVLAIVRAGPLAIYVDQHYGLRSAKFRPQLCVVVLGELYSMAQRKNWGAAKREVLTRIEQELVIVDINQRDVIEAFADLQCATQTQGKSLCQHDLWIAATTKVTGATLLTTDKDFDHLYPDHINRIWVDPASGRMP